MEEAARVEGAPPQHGQQDQQKQEHHQLFELPAPNPFDLELLEPLQAPEGGHLSLFQAEFEKLQQALRKSHQSEERFLRKCVDLKGAIVQTDDKVKALERSNVERGALQAELEAEVAGNREREEEVRAETRALKETISTLRDNEAKLIRRIEESVEELKVEQRSTVSAGENRLSELEARREAERDRLTQRRARAVELDREFRVADERRERSRKELAALQARVHEQESSGAAEQRRISELEREVGDVQRVISDRTGQLAVKRGLLAKARADLEGVVGQLQNADTVVEEHSRRYDDLSRDAATLEDGLEAARREEAAEEEAAKRLAADLAATREAARTTRRDDRRRRAELGRLDEMLGEQEAQHQRFEEEKAAWQRKVVSARERVQQTQFKIKGVGKQADTAVREREVLSQNHAAKVEAGKRKDVALRVARSTLRNMKNEYQGFLTSIRMLGRVIDRLKREKAQYEAELQRRRVQKARAEEEAQRRDVRAAELQRQIADNGARLKQQQNMLEAVRGDRNLYSKTLLEQKGEMKEYRRKFGALNTTIKQLKQDVSEKDIQFVTEHIFLEHVKADIAVLRQQNESDAARIRDMEAVIRSQTEQALKLKAIITEAEEELKQQRKQFNSVVHEQHLLQQQLIERNGEVEEQYGKLRLSESVIRQGEGHFNDRVAALHKLEQSRRDLESRLEDLGADGADYGDLRAAIKGVQAELVQEQLKVKALADELNQPVNVHRWRQLQDTDSSTYEMVRRVQRLQKAIIRKGDEIAAKDQLIQEREQLYVELRRVLGRQPGSETAEQIQLYADTLKDKKAKLKAMQAELAMYHDRVDEYRGDLAKLHDQIRLAKLEYFTNRSRAMQESRRTMNSSRYEPSRSSRAGGVPDAAPPHLEGLDVAQRQNLQRALAEAEQVVADATAANGDGGEEVRSLSAASDAEVLQEQEEEQQQQQPPPLDLSGAQELQQRGLAEGGK